MLYISELSTVFVSSLVEGSECNSIYGTSTNTGTLLDAYSVFLQSSNSIMIPGPFHFFFYS